MHDRPGLEGELISAVIAVELVAILDAGNRRSAATRAANAVRPAKFHKRFAALVFASEALNEFDEVNAPSGHRRPRA